jgi:hypothetical protein
MAFKISRVSEPKKEGIPAIKAGITNADRKSFWNTYDTKKLERISDIKRANS